MLDCTAPTLLGDLPLLAEKKARPCFGLHTLFSVSVAHPSYCRTTAEIYLLTPTAPSGSWCDPGEAWLVHQSCLTNTRFKKAASQDCA